MTSSVLEKTLENKRKELRKEDKDIHRVQSVHAGIVLEKYCQKTQVELLC
jgi:hypothetical protein